MKNNEEFLSELTVLIHGKDTEPLYAAMEENIACFFAMPDIAQYYRLLKDTDISPCKTMIPKLIMAWLAFLCGDNAGLQSILRYIDELDLKGPYESSFYYALKALMGQTSEVQEKLKYGKLSVDILPEGDTSLFMANAKLTYAQILAGLDQYRTAATLFQDAYLMFRAMDMHFPVVVAQVNWLLNRHRLGEFAEVVAECERMLIQSASFRGEAQTYWHILHLPLGLCCFEMNMPSLAIEHLMKAKECIDSMNMFHMHGLIELYLYKSYYVLHDSAAMEEIQAQAVAVFGHMHYTMTDLMLSLFRILSCDGDVRSIQPDIERFEWEYRKRGNENPWMVPETLAYLKLKGWSDAIAAQDLAACLEKLRFIGLLPSIHPFLILLAEMHLLENRPRQAQDCLKEAAAMSKEFGIQVGFYLLPLKSMDLLQKIAPQIYQGVLKKGFVEAVSAQGALLSAREREIMQLIAQGKSNEDISKTLYIGIGTIKWHTNRIFAKLEVGNRIQAAQKAKSLGEI